MTDSVCCPLCEEPLARFCCCNGGGGNLYFLGECRKHGAWGFTLFVQQILTSSKQEHREIRYKTGQLLIEKTLRNKFNQSKDEHFIPGKMITESLLNAVILLGDEESEIPQCTSFQIKLGEFLRKYPTNNMLDILTRSLCNIARHISLPDNYANDFIRHGSTLHNSLIFSLKDSHETNVIKNLVEAGWITSKENANGDERITLTFEGWKKFGELEEAREESNTAFVAMWFSKATAKFRDVAKKAITEAGYDEPIIIDAYEHNNYIMDEVIDQIRHAKFIIADFTCVPETVADDKITGGVRGGVYFEAGFAKGLGKEVIVTCKDDEEAKKRRHFDIEQINTLFWQENSGKLIDSRGNDFQKRLADRIKATVGRGKNKKRT